MSEQLFGAKLILKATQTFQEGRGFEMPNGGIIKDQMYKGYRSKTGFIGIIGKPLFYHGILDHYNPGSFEIL